jgi:hypothetical protein
VHCYGSVGVARELSPDTGTGAELYAVIGHAPRQLDRNIAVVGRVIEGIEHLSTLPRGKGDAGVYDDPALRVPIVSVRLGDELSEPPRFEYLASQSQSFARYVAVRARTGSDAFYNVPAGGDGRVQRAGADPAGRGGMSADRVRFTAPLQIWTNESESSSVGFVILPPGAAEQVAGHELARRLELGKRRGFGSVKVTARVGGSTWDTSVFPQPRELVHGGQCGRAPRGRTRGR